MNLCAFCQKPFPCGDPQCSIPVPPPGPTTTRELGYGDALLEGITEALEADPAVVVLGDSVADPLGTRGSTGLVERFGRDRIIGTPLSEDGVTHAAIGLALAGMRPLQVHIRVDFSMLAMNAIVNLAAKVRTMYGGAIGGCPLTIRLSIGRSWGQGAQHSQALQSFFAHVPGLRVVMPATPADAKGAMLWAMRESADPVIYIDHRMLHKTVGPVSVLYANALQCSPVDGWRLHATGSDVTIVAYSHMAYEARRAVDLLEKLGVRCELFDPLWIRPLPCLPAVAESAATTRRLLVVDCGWSTYGIGAEILAGVVERGVSLEKAARMGFAETSCPTTKALEELYYPSASTIAAKAYQMVTGEKIPAQPNGAGPEVDGFRGPF